MAKFDDVTELLTALNDVTNVLSQKIGVVVVNEEKQLAEIQALKEQIAAGTPVSQAQLDEMATQLSERVAALRAAGDQLGAIAQDPADPLPEPEPEPEPTE